MHIKPHKEPCKGANPQCTSSLVVVRQDAVPSGGNGFYQGAWVTQPSWLHQFRFGWTSAHPITKPGAVTKVESHFFFGPPAPFQEIFFFTWGPRLLTQLPCSKNKFAPTLLLYLCYGFIFSKLYFILLSLSMLQLCTHPLLSLMFREELGIATTSRCEQHEVQYFQEDTKTKFAFYNFFCTCGFSTFSIWV
jgi:hypothetical protein